MTYWDEMQEISEVGGARIMKQVWKRKRRDSGAEIGRFLSLSAPIIRALLAAQSTSWLDLETLTLQRLWFIWGQCCPRVAAAPSLPNGPITQLSPYFTRKPGRRYDSFSSFLPSCVGLLRVHWPPKRARSCDMEMIGHSCWPHLFIQADPGGALRFICQQNAGAEWQVPYLPFSFAIWKLINEISF